MFLQQDPEGGDVVFICGPRQVAKTTLALSFLDPPTPGDKAYQNCDIVRHHRAPRECRVPADESVVLLGETRTFSKWRELVKRFFNEFKGRVKNHSHRVDSARSFL
jgi:uncharacterized protein